MSLTAFKLIPTTTIHKGVTYDEVFCTLNRLFEDLTDGWGIAETFSNLVSMAKKVQNEPNCKEECAIIVYRKGDNINDEDYVYCQKMNELMLKDSWIKENIHFLKVCFYEDASLEELTIMDETTFEDIKSTVESYLLTNADVLSEIEKEKYKKQINILEHLKKSI